MKKLFLIPLVIALMITLNFGITVPVSAAEKTWTLKYHHEMPATGSYHRYGHKPYADAVEKLGGPDLMSTRLWWDTGGPNF